MKCGWFSLVVIAAVVVQAGFGHEVGYDRERGVVEYIEGSVLINGEEADFGQLVGLGSRIQTGAGSTVEIVFSGRNVFRLGENSVALLNIGSVGRDVELRTGTLYAVLNDLRPIGSRDARFRLRTPTAVGGVQESASFFVRVVDERNTYIYICNGIVDTNDLNGTTPMILRGGEHEAYLFTRDIGRTPVVNRVPIEHNDNEDINELAKKINVVVSGCVSAE